MATKVADRPGVSKYDNQPKKVYVDYAFNEVSEGSDAAAFSFLPHDLERVRARREELGMNDDKARSQEASRKAELKLAESKAAAAMAHVDALKAQMSDAKDDAKADKPEK